MKTNNAVTQEMIDNWKKKYKHIWKTTIGNESFIFRALRRSEYVEVMTTKYDDEAVKIFERQDEIVRKAVLYPENIAEVVDEVGGISSTIADAILEKSGFDMSHTEEL